MLTQFEPREWTISQVLGGAYRTFARQPADLAAAVLIIPLVWALPHRLLHDHVLPSGEPLPGTTDAWLSLAFSSATTLWDSIWYAGTFSVALNAVRDQPLRWRAFLTGIRLAPAIAIAELVVTAPLDLLSLLPIVPVDALGSFLTFLAVIALFWLLARTAFLVPLLVDAKLSLPASFRASWHASRGQTPRLLALTASVFALCLPLLLLEALKRDEPLLSTAIFQGLLTMTGAYLFHVGLARRPSAEGSA